MSNHSRRMAPEHTGPATAISSGNVRSPHRSSAFQRRDPERPAEGAPPRDVPTARPEVRLDVRSQPTRDLLRRAATGLDRRDDVALRDEEADERPGVHLERAGVVRLTAHAEPGARR